MRKGKDARKEIVVTRRGIVVALLGLILALAASITAWSLSNQGQSWGASSTVSSKEGKVEKTMPVKVRVINPLHP